MKWSKQGYVRCTKWAMNPPKEKGKEFMGYQNPFDYVNLPNSTMFLE